MFSPGTKRSNFSARKDRSVGGVVTDTPIKSLQSLAENRTPPQHTSIPVRPATGTPAPWASRLSTLARITPAKKGEKADGKDPIQPIYVGEYPQIVRNEQAIFLQKHVPGDAHFSGGMDKETCLAWIICGSKLFIWSYLSPAVSRKCVVLDLPSTILNSGDTGVDSCHANTWLLCVVNWDSKQKGEQKVVQSCNSAGVLLCNKKVRALAYWPDIYSEAVTTPLTSLASTDESEVNCSPVDAKILLNKPQQRKRPGSSLAGSSYFNSLIVSMVPDTQNACISLACSSNGELWQFHCSPFGIQRRRAYHNMTLSSQGDDGYQQPGCKGYPRSLIWHFPHHSFNEPKRLFLLLTDHEIQCLAINLSADLCVSKLWSHEIIGTDGYLGVQKDLAGQKQIWPLDLQIDNHGKLITVLIATFCKDRVSSSSYIQYSLLTMQYRTGISIPIDFSETLNERVLEKTAPVQVIIPKARVEEEDFLFSMRLRVGGKPSGSAVIISSDGTATVSHYWRNSTRLYQFDLPYDAGKVVDASVFPSSDDGEDGAWAVLTEKAGVWAIPEKAVLLGGVEPPERSLSRKGSSNEGSMKDHQTFLANFIPRRVSSEVWDAGDKQKAGFTRIVHQSVRDEESEALLSHLFNDFLLSGKVDDALGKFRSSGAFARDGETNAFTRISKSIVDTLAKHWTTTRGTEIVALGVVSMQLMEKQQKHTKFLQFLALSKCHEELSSQQRESLHLIMEHGEKLAGMVQLRELQSMINQNRLNAVATPSSENEISGALWDLIQLVGEKARRNTVLLMDRDNAEVFYSKVSDLQEVFNCLEKYLECVISEKMPFTIQLQRACELSNACVTLLRMATHYRNEHHMWYPSPEGLTPWYCQAVVRNGLWSLAYFMLQLSNDVYHLEKFAKLDFYSHLEILADVLLEAYSVAIRAKIERGEDHKSLLDEDWKRRDSLLDFLYQQLKRFSQAQYKDSGEGTEEYSEEILGKLSSNLLSIAKRHESYRTLWNICCDLNDSELLKNLMRESMGPKGGFSCFVFNQLYESKQLFKLMRLGEEFQEELDTFLKFRPELRWLHEVFLHQFSSASETLHILALSQDDISISETDVQASTHGTSNRMTLADRKRLLNLSKIAAMAGTNTDYDIKMKRIDADLKIMKLQEKILELVPDKKEIKDIRQQLLPPVDLIELCLNSQNRMLSLLAFDVFAWTSSSFLKCNTSLLEECWRNAADQDDWERLYQRSVVEGWSDEDTFKVLRETVLFQASWRCYRQEAETFEGGFDEVLPLSQENLEVPTSRDVLSSVEAILMGHKAFPDAGKLMLMAVMSGSLQDDASMEEGASPM